ncbi:hypothetical protein B0H15DRAFT_520779 [Mycena belliarum]|uniref:Uncharacterized protein n=1 Tax=Mycena belliarum TaxID=1033014 RepID=A0AAD6XL99_9AGAR|nr:hypothetical protein B0H15DRAFT_520779 [Mycena belliae]
MSSPAASAYIVHLQAIPPSLFFMVPLATIVLFFLAVSHTVIRHTHDPVIIHVRLLDRPKRRVAWVFPIVFSLALLAILAGALLLLRERTNSLAWTVADSVVTAVLYVELSVSNLYLLNLVAPVGAIHPVAFYLYCMVQAIMIISATLLSVVGSFKAILPLVSPILYLTTTVLTIPVIAFSFLSSLQPAEASLAPHITLSSTYSFPPSSSEKPQLLQEVSSSLEISHMSITTLAPSRTIFVYILCGQISAIVHFAFAICILVLLPDQSFPPSTLTSEEVVAGVWAEALVFRAVQTAFLVSWIICLTAAFLQLFARVNRPTPRASMLTDATAFTSLPPRTHRPQSKSRSSSFSSPRPRRPLYTPPRRGSPPGVDDCQNLHDPFASPVKRSALADAGAGGAPRQTRMSTWGTLPPAIPPRPPPNVLVINPPARRLPSLSALRGAAAVDGRRSLSMFSYTTPSAYSQDGDDGYDSAFDVEEALLAQQLLRRLDAAGGGWKLGRNGSAGSTLKARRP